MVRRRVALYSGMDMMSWLMLPGKGEYPVSSLTSPDPSVALGVSGHTQTQTQSEIEHTVIHVRTRRGALT